MEVTKNECSTSLYRQFYLHFNIRLKERYGFGITFEEYMEACGAPMEEPIIPDKSNKYRKIIWLNIKGYRVLVVKNIGQSPAAALVTALPAGNIHKY